MLRDWTKGQLSSNAAEDAALKAAKKPAVINMSIDYNIVTEYTSFIAVEKRTVSLPRFRAFGMGFAVTFGMCRRMRSAVEQPQLNRLT